MFPNPRTKITVIIGLAICIVDQLSKSWAKAELVLRDIDLFWTLKFSLTYNRGAAFGIGEGWAPVLVLAGVVVIVITVMVARPHDSRIGAVALGLVLGGAVGNLIDRIFREPRAVVDFIDFGWWPAFNIADSAIVVGVGLLIYMLKDSDAKHTDVEEDQSI